MQDLGFDPISELFVANYDRPAYIEDVNLRTLSSFQRALLVIDGTVTKFLEAVTMEPVEVKPIKQNQRTLTADHELLKATAGTQIMTRQVALQGKYSYRLYAYASSMIVPERLGVSERWKVEKSQEGLGRILNAGRRPQYRELLWYGKEYPAELPGIQEKILKRGFLSRMYRIYYGEVPIILINEKFPFDEQSIPFHH
jgi:chorismate-pyruvate lyase